MRATHAATLVALGFGFLAGGTVAHGQAPGTSADKNVTLTLHAVNHSGVTGTATLIPVGSKLRVVLILAKPVKGALPAYIRRGTCKSQPITNKLRIRHFLNGVVGGRSDTLVSDTLKKLQQGVFSINVYQQERPDLAIVCGEIPLT